MVDNLPMVGNLTMVISPMVRAHYLMRAEYLMCNSEEALSQSPIHLGGGAQQRLASCCCWAAGEPETSWWRGVTLHPPTAAGLLASSLFRSRLPDSPCRGQVFGPRRAEILQPRLPLSGLGARNTSWARRTSPCNLGDAESSFARVVLVQMASSRCFSATEGR